MSVNTDTKKLHTNTQRPQYPMGSRLRQQSSYTYQSLVARITRAAQNIINGELLNNKGQKAA